MFRNAHCTLAIAYSPNDVCVIAMICRMEGGGRITELPCLSLGVFLPSDNDRPAALARGRLPVAAAARRRLVERKGKYE